MTAVELQSLPERDQVAWIVDASAEDVTKVIVELLLVVLIERSLEPVVKFVRVCRKASALPDVDELCEQLLAKSRVIAGKYGIPVDGNVN